MDSADILLQYGAAIRIIRKMLKRINANITTACKFLKTLDRDTSGHGYVARIETCIGAMRRYRNTTEAIETTMRADFAGVLGLCPTADRNRLTKMLEDMHAASVGAETELSVALAIMCTTKLQ